MPTPIAGPVPVTAEAVAFEFSLVDDANGVLGELAPDRDRPPSLRWDQWGAYPRTLSTVRLLDADVALVDLNDRVRLWAVDASGVRTSIGHFLFTAMPLVTRGGSTVRECALADLAVLLDTPLFAATGFAAGVNVAAAITDLANTLAWPLGFDVSASDVTLAEPVSYPAGTKIGDAVDRLCVLAGFVPPQWDGDGYGRVDPPADLDTAFAADFDYDTDATVTDAGYTENAGLFDAPNTWIATSNSPGQREVTGSFTLPASAPNSVSATGRVNAVAVPVPGASTVSVCEQAARAAAAKSGGQIVVTFSAVADFDHDVGQTAIFDGERWRDEAWDVTLSAGEPMQHRLTREYE